MTILITGGAGYIGSHAVLAFREAGYKVVVLDDLSTGRRDLLMPEVPLVEGNAGDARLIAQVIREYGITAVAHFAGSIVVPESVSDPLKYYLNNTSVSASLIQTCIETGVRRFIFSSTAAVYGTPSEMEVTEETPLRPESPYGRTKLITEWVLEDTAAAHDFAYVALRYFNVAGADPAGRSGHCAENATHLLKVACEAATGQREGLDIYGEDYDTPDGTCIRDFIHVSDLAAAHVEALRYLEAGGASLAINCGYGRGYSVRQVLAAVEEATGVPLRVRSAPRRPGDPVALVANSDRLRETFAWQPKYDDLDVIVKSALRWERHLLERT